MNTLFEIIASLTESFIVVRLCNGFLDHKSKNMIWFESAIFFILLSAENILLSQLENFENISACFFLLLIFGYSLLFLEGKIYEKALLAIIPAITILPINLIILSTFRTWSGCSISDIIEPGGKFRLPVLIFSKLTFFFVCEFIINLRKRKRYSLSRFQWMIQLSCFFITFLTAYSLLNISVVNEEIPRLLFVSIMIAILNILLYTMMDKMQHDSILKEEYEISKINLASQERFVDEAREQYLQMRTLRHDMRHYFMTAAELISADRAKDAKDYLEQIMNEKINPLTAGIDTGNVIINAVINNKIALCQKHDIEIKCMIDSQIKNIDDMDISILLSNVLDNAINGCSGADSPEIELIIGTRKSFTYIIVKNSIPSSVLLENPNLETSSKDRSSHGYGIMSIKKIAEKYKGSVDFREENNTFITEIWLESAACHL